ALSGSAKRRALAVPRHGGRSRDSGSGYAARAAFRRARRCCRQEGQMPWLTGAVWPRAIRRVISLKHHAHTTITTVKWLDRSTGGSRERGCPAGADGWIAGGSTHRPDGTGTHRIPTRVAAVRQSDDPAAARLSRAIARRGRSSRMLEKGDAPWLPP